jgi:hypothetical protein
MKEVLHSQIEEKREKTISERFRVRKDVSEKMKEDCKHLEDEEMIRQIVKEKKVSDYKKMLSEQISNKREELTMNETEKKINKKLLEKIR